MAEINLGVCLEGIRRAIVYGERLLEYKRHPRKVGKGIGRTSAEGYLKALKAIADNCPISETLRETLIEKYENYKDSPWESFVEFGIFPDEVFRYPVNALWDMEKYYGFRQEDYEKYIPR